MTLLQFATGYLAVFWLVLIMLYVHNEKTPMDKMINLLLAVFWPITAIMTVLGYFLWRDDDQR